MDSDQFNARDETSGLVQAERQYSAYRIGLGIALVYLVFVYLIPAVLNYSALVTRTTRDSHRLIAQQHRLSAADLESMLRQQRQFAGPSQLQCTPAVREWDYVCIYLPTPLQSQTRLQFGVAVDSTRWVQVSRVVPIGTSIPPRQ